MSLKSILSAAIAALALVTGAASADEPVNVRIAWVVPIANWASILYEKKDLMTHYGKSYTVEPVHFQSTPQMITALGAGELEIADLAYSSFGIAVENAGMSDLRIIADEARDGYDGYYSGEYCVLKDGPIKTIEDLKGKTVGTVGEGSAIDIPVKILLRKHGLESPRDYTVVEAPFNNMPAMLLAKKLDFIATVPPFSLNPDLKAQGRVLFTVKDALEGPTEFIIWAARNEFLQKHRAAMVDLFEDAVRVTRFLTDPKNHDAAVQIAAKVIKQPPERLGWVYTKVNDYSDPNMRPDLASFQRAVDLTQQNGFLKQKLDVQKYADLSILEDAIKRLPPQ
ncbi:MAG TPA: ABC transporter substrate-binding protein [Stellaceae bacterium]|nr:ABC transporter substrate-binding protein [Stellaceae bacterium]